MVKVNKEEKGDNEKEGIIRKMKEKTILQKFGKILFQSSGPNR